MQDMRDFRDAKAMARTLRAALAAKGHRITISESLELIAHAFGVADWNTLSATIRAQTPRESASPPPPTAESLGAARFSAPSAAGGETPMFSAELESTLHRALACADQRHHEYATLEHLLLALIDDADASATMKACQVDIGALKEGLANYIDNELKQLVVDHGNGTRPTAGFQRVVQRAVIQTQGLGRHTVTGAELIANIFAERESPAAYFLQEQDMTRYDAVNFIVYGIVKGGGGAAA
jgi:Glyoxalase superfamily protein/Clp amino terminal domain, pathogenicity island component